MSLYTSIAKPVLFALDAEQAHNLVLGALAHDWVASAVGRDRKSTRLNSSH